MSSENFVLIVTDENDSINQIAQILKSTLEACNYDVQICCANDFEGTDLLRSSAFFMGCNTPNPDSFSYIQEILDHINLASRRCGIFSVNEEALKYLRDILNDSEAVCKELLFVNEKTDEPAVEKWAKEILG